MTELSITVACPGEREATYRFAEYPVRIGRSPECHLAICHEAVPRDLCSAWLERDGRTVRVEERPNLTNPLFVGNTLVRGGVSAVEVVLTVGPVMLRIASLNSGEHSAGGETKNRLKPALAIAAAAALFVAVASLFLGRDGIQRASAIDRLPQEPFCGELQEHCGSSESCLERARLLSTRARELLSRADGNPAQKVLAAKMLAKAAELYGDFRAPEAVQIYEEARGIRQEIVKSYRQDVVALRGALIQRDGALATARASTVLAYLGDCSRNDKSWLENLVAEMEPQEN